MTDIDDEALETRLAQALGPQADDTAPLARAVLNRLAEPVQERPAAASEVLVLPLPAAGVMLGLLVLAVALGYALAPADLDEVAALIQLLNPGF